MNAIALSKHNPVFADPAFKRTLHDTSARKPDENTCQSQEMYAFPDSYATSEIDCLDFDAIKLRFYPPQTLTNTPCSADALYLASNGTFLVEFKSDTAVIENVIRKAYDSVMLLIEHDGYCFQQARRELTYLVVSTGIDNHITGHDRSLGRAKSYCQKPWIKFRKNDDHWKVASLEGIIVKEAYCMHPATFNYYAKLNCWK